MALRPSLSWSMPMLERLGETPLQSASSLWTPTSTSCLGMLIFILWQALTTLMATRSSAAISADTSYGQSNPNAEIARTRIRDIRVSDVHAREAERRLNLRGDPAARVQGVVIRNATVEGPCLRPDIVENVDGLVDEKRP